MGHFHHASHGCHDTMSWWLDCHHILTYITCMWEAMKAWNGLNSCHVQILLQKVFTTASIWSSQGERLDTQQFTMFPKCFQNLWTAVIKNYQLLAKIKPIIFTTSRIELCFRSLIIGFLLVALGCVFAQVALSMVLGKLGLGELGPTVWGH